MKLYIKVGTLPRGLYNVRTLRGKRMKKKPEVGDFMEIRDVLADRGTKWDTVLVDKVDDTIPCVFVSRW